MRKFRPLWIVLLMLPGFSLARQNPSSLPTTLAAKRALWSYAHLPLSFEPNEGQTDAQVRFLAHGPGYGFFLTDTGAVLALGGPRARQAAVRLELMGASRRVKVSGEDELAGKANYFIGRDPRGWHTNIPTYARVQYRGVYRGIDLVYYGRAGELENDFVVAPGADPGEVRMKIEGGNGIRLTKAGALVVETKAGEVELHRPIGYQGKGAERRQVRIRYEWRGKDVIGLSVAGYRRSKPLVIDPVLSYSTYLGGSGGDIGNGIDVDSNDDTFICGATSSTNFPTLNGEQTTYGGSGDAFVTELNPTGTKLIYSTYLGGSGADSAAACALSATNNLYVTGTTFSPDFPIFPTASSTTTPPFQTTYGGNGDAFVTELSSTGSALVYSSYLGGSGADAGQGIAVDSSGNAYVTGSTQSPDFPMPGASQTPTPPAPIQGQLAGGSDAFLVKVNISGTQLLYSTYLGGSAADTGQAIALDSSDNAYIAGYTFSSNFPIQNPTQSTLAGTSNAFVSEINPTVSGPSGLLFSTYLGGGGQDQGLGIGLDPSGNVDVTGETTSSSANSPFPTMNPYQGTLKGAQNAFVTEFSPGTKAGTFTIAYSTYLGGSGTDQGNGIAADSSGDIYVTGFTRSTDFPTSNPTQGLFGITGAATTCGTVTCADVFVSELNPKSVSTGSQLVFSTFLGGSGDDHGQAVAVDKSGNIFVTGSTASSNFPVIIGSYQTALGGVSGNAFVAEIKTANAPAVAAAPGKLDFGNQTVGVTSSSQSVTIINEGTSPLTISAISIGNTVFKQSSNCVGTVSPGGSTCTISVTFTPSATGSATGNVTITDNAAGSPQTIPLSGSGVTSSSAVTLTPTSLTFGNQQVGTASSPQTVTITNTGSSTVNITAIAVSSNFQQTNTCGTLGNVLNVGQSCAVSVIFTPTSSGPLSGSLSISDTAIGSPQTAALSGTGSALFSLSSPNPVGTALIGTTSTTFTLTASAASSFTGSISLTCSTGTCSFNPKSILPGQSSTLTLSNLSATTPNPFNFTVNGQSGSQGTTLALRLQLEDYALSISPLLNTILPGSSASYTIVVTPSFGFNHAVTLSCTANVPPGGGCSFSPTTVTPSGSSPASSRLIITTTAGSGVWGLWRGPKPPQWMLILCLAWLVLMLALWMMGRRVALRSSAGLAQRRAWMAWRVLPLAGLLLLLFAFASCRGVASTTSTPSGNYFVRVTGTLLSNTAVTRSTTATLAVTPAP